MFQLQKFIIQMYKKKCIYHIPYGCYTTRNPQYPHITLIVLSKMATVKILVFSHSASSFSFLPKPSVFYGMLSVTWQVKVCLLLVISKCTIICLPLQTDCTLDITKGTHQHNNVPLMPCLSGTSSGSGNSMEGRLHYRTSQSALLLSSVGA